MKLKIFNLFMIICLSYSLVNAQTFTGRLTYKFTVDKSNLEKDSLLVQLTQAFEIPSKSITTILIKGNRLYSKCKTLENKTMFKEYQNKDTAYLLGQGKKPNEKFSSSMFPVKQPLYKSEEFKMILGFKCKKYMYSDINSEQTYVAWIPDNYKFKEQTKNGKFFSSYFFPDGLAFRFEAIYKDIISIFELIHIEIYNVLDSEFEMED